MESRKNTPCTSPWTITRRLITNLFSPLGRSDLRDQLLLVVSGVLARGVERLDRCRVGEAAARVDAEVVPDEACRVADAVEARRRKLWVPRVRREPDVVADRPELRAIELDRGVDAVVLPSLWQARIEEQSRDRRLGRARSRTGQSPIVESNGHGPIGRHYEIRLQRVPDPGRVVHLDGA